MAHANEWYEQVLATKTDDPRLLSMALQSLAWVACQQGDFRQVRHYIEAADGYLQKGVVRLTRRQLMEQQLTMTQASLAEAIRGYEIAGIQAQTKALATNRQNPTDPARWQAAKTHLQQGLSLARTIGFADGVGSGLLVALGWLALHTGDIAQATTYFQEGLQIAQTISHQERISNLNLGLGLTALQQADLPQAEAHLAISQQVAHNIHHQALEIAGTLAQGWVAIHNHDVAKAQQQWQTCQNLLANNNQHPMFNLITLGLQMLDSGADITTDFDELEPLIWDILQTTSLTTLPHTIWQ
jgi:tetratricopeptide (TPR) repeat protein